MSTKQSIENMLNDLPVFSTHQHHMESEKQQESDLHTFYALSWWISVDI